MEKEKNIIGMEKSLEEYNREKKRKRESEDSERKEMWEKERRERMMIEKERKEKEKLPNHRKLVFQENKNNRNIRFPDVEIYSSEFSGLGKSTLIKNEFENEFKGISYSPIPNPQH